MRYNKYVFLACMLICAETPAMIIETESSNIHQVDLSGQVPSLKQQAARAICHSLRYDTKQASIDQAKKLIKGIEKNNNRDIESYILERIKIENADIFKSIYRESSCILHQQAVPIKAALITSDTKQLWLRDDQIPNQFIKIDIEQAKRITVDLRNSRYRVMPHNLDSHQCFAPNQDGSQLAIVCEKIGSPNQVFLITHTLHSSHYSEIMPIPQRLISLHSFFDHIVLAKNINPAINSAYLINCRERKITEIPGQLITAKPSHHLFITKSSPDTITLHATDGSNQGAYAHTGHQPSFNSSATLLATINHQRAHLYRIATQELIHTLEYKHPVKHVSFKNDTTLLTQVNDPTGNNYFYETDLQTGKSFILSNGGCINQIGTEGLQEKDDFTELLSTEHNKLLTSYNNTHGSKIYGPGFMNNDRHIILQEKISFGSHYVFFLMRYTSALRSTEGRSLQELLHRCLDKKENKIFHRLQSFFTTLFK